MGADVTRRFPIHSDSVRRMPVGAPMSVPWSLLAPHEAQAQRNHGGQSLERLAERGGLSLCEMCAVIEDRRWRHMEHEDALARIHRAIEDHARQSVPVVPSNRQTP